MDPLFCFDREQSRSSSTVESEIIYFGTEGVHFSIEYYYSTRIATAWLAIEGRTKLAASIRLLSLFLSFVKFKTVSSGVES
ncbi:hypothetical protein P8452_21403 [Trifolium repens]|nr:hypothetical protein P8452_21403 [Trifolium repens]